METLCCCFRPLVLEAEFLVRVSQKTKCGAGFSSTFVLRHLFLRQRSLKLQRTSISSDSQNCPEMEKENQITIAIVASYNPLQHLSTVKCQS